MPAHGHGERLSPVDASFLQLESARRTCTSPGARCSRRPRAARAPTHRGHPRPRHRPPGLGAALPPAPAARAARLGEPRWVDDERFDVAAHVVALTDPADPVGPERFAAAARRAALPAAGSPPPAVAARVRPAAGRRAPRRHRPRAPRDGRRRRRAADRAADDRHRRPRDAGAPRPRRGRPRRRRRRCSARSTRSCTAPSCARGAARDVAHAVTHPRAAAGDALRDAGRLVHALSQDLLPHAPASGLNRPLGPRRTLVQHRVALDDVRAVSRGAPGTRNDVGLAAIAGALRALALEHGRVRRAAEGDGAGQHAPRSDAATLGNRVSMTSVWLPLDLAVAGRPPGARPRADRALQGQRAAAGRADADLRLRPAAQRAARTGPARRPAGPLQPDDLQRAGPAGRAVHARHAPGRAVSGDPDRRATRRSRSGCCPTRATCTSACTPTPTGCPRRRASPS